MVSHHSFCVEKIVKKMQEKGIWMQIKLFVKFDLKLTQGRKATIYVCI